MLFKKEDSQNQDLQLPTSLPSRLCKCQLKGHSAKSNVPDGSSRLSRLVQPNQQDQQDQDLQDLEF